MKRFIKLSNKVKLRVFEPLARALANFGSGFYTVSSFHELERSIFLQALVTDLASSNSEMKIIMGSWNDADWTISQKLIFGAYAYGQEMYADQVSSENHRINFMKRSLEKFTRIIQGKNLDIFNNQDCLEAKRGSLIDLQSRWEKLQRKLLKCIKNRKNAIICLENIDRFYADIAGDPVTLRFRFATCLKGFALENNVRIIVTCKDEMPATEAFTEMHQSAIRNLEWMCNFGMLVSSNEPEADKIGVSLFCHPTFDTTKMQHPSKGLSLGITCLPDIQKLNPSDLGFELT